MRWRKAMAAMRAYERPLAERLISGLLAIPSLTIQGIADRTRFDQRVPTISFRPDRCTPRQAAARLLSGYRPQCHFIRFAL